MDTLSQPTDKTKNIVRVDMEEFSQSILSYRNAFYDSTRPPGLSELKRGLLSVDDH